MTISYEVISEAEFNQLPQKIFHDPKTDRRFAKVKSNDMTFVFGWRSDLVEPTILDLGDGSFLVAVDQDVAIIESSTGRPLLRMNLPENFHQALYARNRVYLATEQCVFLVVGPEWKVVAKRDLPDYFEAFNLSSGQISAICMDGTAVMLPD